MNREIDLIVIHCADTPADMDIGVEEIDQWHRQRGWNGCGYHYVIRRAGSVETGRDLTTQGAHVEGHNHNSIGICLVGGKPDCNFTRAQWDELERLVTTLVIRFPQAKVVGHRDLDPNRTCPLFDVGAWWAS